MGQVFNSKLALKDTAACDDRRESPAIIENKSLLLGQNYSLFHVVKSDFVYLES